MHINHNVKGRKRAGKCVRHKSQSEEQPLAGRGQTEEENDRREAKITNQAQWAFVKSSIAQCCSHTHLFNQKPLNNRPSIYKSIYTTDSRDSGYTSDFHLTNQATSKASRLHINVSGVFFLKEWICEHTVLYPLFDLYHFVNDNKARKLHFNIVKQWNISTLKGAVCCFYTCLMRHLCFLSTVPPGVAGGACWESTSLPDRQTAACLRQGTMCTSISSILVNDKTPHSDGKQCIRYWPWLATFGPV